MLTTTSRAELARLLARFSRDIATEIDGKWEAYRVASMEVEVRPIQRALVIAGSDERATMFGLYAFAEKYLGVDPLWFWADNPPRKRERLAWDDVRIAADEPTFPYRGWFINDEDLLTEWCNDGGRRNIDYPYYAQVTSPKASARVYEAMLRLQMNLVVPASFVDIRNPAEKRLVDAAARRGLLVTMHHIEPLGVSGFGFLNYWRDQGEDVPFSFVRHRDRFETVWRDYARRWAAYGDQVVWQLGLRGIADRPVWVSDPSVPNTSEARGKLISDAMRLQWEIIRSVDCREQPSATTTLWMEGSSLHQAGHLTFPEGVAVIFADNSPGWQLQRDFYEVEREPGRPYGIYYHHQLWGTGPHLAQGVSPQRCYGIFKLAVERGSTHYAMLNVSNVREFLLGGDASARFLRDFDAFDPDEYLTAWCRERFGPAAGDAGQCYRQFFASYVDPESGARQLLDGETRSVGSRFLKVLLERRNKEKPFNDPDRVKAMASKVAGHRAQVEVCGEGVDRVLDALEGPKRQLFQTNFVVQQRILLALLRWHEECLLAGVALHRGDREAAVDHLEAALDAIRSIRDAKALASYGKWKHWYRGDKKMNIPAVEKLTEQVVEAYRTGR